MVSFTGGMSVDLELDGAATTLHSSRNRDGWWGVSRFAYDDALDLLVRRIAMVRS